MSAFKIPENRVQTDQRQTFFSSVPIDCPHEAALDTAFWAHAARKLTPGDEITMVPDGLAWHARFFVIDRGDNWARVALVSFTDLSAVEMASAGATVDQFDIAWKGPAWQFTVSRAGTRDEPLAKGFKTRAEANRWVLENGKAIARLPDAKGTAAA